MESQSSQSLSLEHKIGGAQIKAMAPASGSFARRNLQSPSTMNPNYRMNGKIVISALAILFFIVFVILLIHIYAKLLRRRSSTICGRLHHSVFSQDSPDLRDGLDKEIVEALPIFGYKSPCLSNSTEPQAFEVAECVVCLSVFQQDETCKLLPKCKHFFHIDCIDMWFVSNTTCPLCRMAADPSDCTNQDGGNELREQYRRAVDPNGTRDRIACGINTNDDWERQGGSLLRGHFSLQSPTTSRNYRRLKSEKFSHGTQGGALPTNVLFWGNHMHTAPRMNPTHWKTGGRSFSHTTIDIKRPLVVVSSCPALQGSPEPCSSLPHLVHRPPLKELKSLKRFPSN